jgi:asparagine synthase (glutamine-hydrolysing)
VSVTFNGEIYGYRDLRRDYANFQFHTNSDTEVILAVYKRHGVDAPKHLPGMFAFAVWDDDKQELLCARDRFGEKPFFYAIGRKGEFIFASEIKAVLASGLIDPRIDSNAIARYLQRQCARSDRTIYANVFSLPPAHVLRHRSGRTEIDRYWSFPEVKHDIDAQSAEEEFEALLNRAVRRQLVADVPIGAFLSGGLDSTTICCVASGMVDELMTFSFDFEGTHSEAEFARDAAAQFSSRHVELSVGKVDLALQVRLTQSVFDEPFGDTSAIPTYLLSREARKHVKVVLTGDGGDELFGGYAWYKPLMWMQRAGRVGLIRWTAERLANRLGQVVGLPGAAARELRIMGLGFGRRHRSLLDAHHEQMQFFSISELERLGLLNCDRGAEEGDRLRNGSMDDVLRADVGDYMPSDILTKIDRASMSHGLELRAPFLDVDFASFCLTLPYRLKLSTETDKIILRKAYSASWPPSIRKRDKQGFGVPLGRWFADEGIKELEQLTLRNSRAPIFDFLSFDEVNHILKVGDLMKRWTLLNLGVWFSARNAGCQAQQPTPA